MHDHNAWQSHAGECCKGHLPAVLRSSAWKISSSWDCCISWLHMASKSSSTSSVLSGEEGDVDCPLPLPGDFGFAPLSGDLLASLFIVIPNFFKVLIIMEDSRNWSDGHVSVHLLFIRASVVRLPCGRRPSKAANRCSPDHERAVSWRWELDAPAMSGRRTVVNLMDRYPHVVKKNS